MSHLVNVAQNFLRDDFYANVTCHALCGQRLDSVIFVTLATHSVAPTAITRLRTDFYNPAMRKLTFILAALGFSLVVSTGCNVAGPDFSNRESVQQQRDRAGGNRRTGQAGFDPFPASDVGPGDEDLRPQGFSTPRPPIEQSRAVIGQGK